MAQRLSEVAGVGHVSVQGGIRPAVRIQADLARLAAYGLGMEDLRTAIVGANVVGPEGLARRRASVLHHRRQRPDRQRRGLPHGRRRLPQRRAGAAAATWPTWSTAWRTPRSAAGTRASRPSSSTSSASPAPTSSRPSSASRPSCRGCSAPCRAASTLTVVHDRTDTIRASVRDVQFTLVLERRPGGAGGASVPAHHPRHHHRRRGAAAVADRHLRRDVVLRLLRSTTCR